MKKTILIVVGSIGLTATAGAQKLDAAKVPEAVKSAFAKKYPGMSAKWENEKGMFEAGFKAHGQDMSVLFSADGTMTESEVDIKVSELPAPVQPYIKAHYKGAAIKEAAKITKTDGTVTYEAEVNKMDVIFDSKGNFMKEVRD